MRKSRYIELAAEIEKIEREFEVLDSKNPIEQERISLLKLELVTLTDRIKLYDKESRLAKFTLIEGQG